MTPDAIAQQLQQTLIERGLSPQWAAMAPGRVNLIGEHTDYSGGFALPMAVDLYTIAVAAPCAGHTIRVLSESKGMAELNLRDLKPEGDWADYLRGVLAGYVDREFSIPAMTVAIGGNLPLGAGLSSSASLELCFAMLIETATSKSLDPADRALLCQQSEHQFAGVPCGILDQYAVSFATADRAMLLDCRDRSTRPVTIPKSFAIAVVDSGVSHALGDGGYATRRSEVEAAEAALGKSLRDAELTELDNISEENVRARAKHIITENARVIDFCSSIESGDGGAAGETMFASHRSLAQDFEVSCTELDQLVAAAQRHGALGARMTGGGFGGSMVALVGQEDKERFATALQADFQSGFDVTPTLRWVRPSAGTKALSLTTLANAP